MPREQSESGDNLDDDWSDDESDDGLMSCPYCGEEMYDDSPRCPECGRYLSEEDTVETKPKWVMITAVLLLIALLAGLASFF